MTQIIDPSLIILLILAGLGYFSGNNTVTIAVFILIIFKLPYINTTLPWLEKKGLFIGIVILTVSVMVPIATGKVNLKMLLHSFIEWRPLLAIAVGILVSWLGARGVTVMTNVPSLVPGLIIGTVIGVALFKGIPVGPLIAAGMISLIIGKGN